MIRKYALRSAAALLSGAIALSATTAASGSADAPEETSTLSAPEETSEPTSADSPEAIVEAAAEEERAEKEEINWKKADISAYDASMSLVSYEPTTPDMLKTVGVPTGSAKPEISEEERLAMIARRKAIKKLTPSLTRKSRSSEPTAVELYLSGRPVGNVPPDREVYAAASPGDFAFVTYGWGHGVGMSQNGANLYATYSGWTYQDILFHYYPGTYLVNANEVDDEEITIRQEPSNMTTLEILSQIVYNEVGGSMAYEAIKAQAVAAYTYIKFNGDDISDLCPKPNPPQIVIDACTEVLGEALFYDGDFALTMFSASSGGCSANCYEIFYQDVPYLRSVPSDWDGAYDPHFGTVTYVSAADMKSRIENKFGLKLSDDPANWIQPVYSEETGYVSDVCIDGQIWVRGYAFSLPMGIKSPKFTVTYSPGDPEEPVEYVPEWNEGDFIEDYEEMQNGGAAEPAGTSFPTGDAPEAATVPATTRQSEEEE